MNPRRDRAIAGAAVAVVVLLAVLVVSAVLDAQRNGRKALERLQTQQVNQLTKSLTVRLSQVDDAFSSTPFQMTPRSLADSAILGRLTTTGRTGAYLVTTDRTIVNGTRLLDPNVIGTSYGDTRLLRSAAATHDAQLGSVKRGITTASKVIDAVVPLDGGREASPTGYVVLEVEVGPDAFFNQEVSALRSGKTGIFSYVDRNGVAAASSDTSVIGRRLASIGPIPPITPGFHRGHGRIVAAAGVPNTEWRAVFMQNTSEFEGDLTRPLRSALLLLALATVIVGGILAAALVRRLRAARDEQRRLVEINAAQEEFIGIVSHELRTPVSGLLGFLQTTLDHWDAMNDDDRRRAVGRGLANARRLQALTSDVLDASRIESGDFPYAFDRIDLRDEVVAAVDAAQDSRPGHPITMRTPDQPVWVDADADRINQVLTNLLDNALRHSPPDGAVDVEVTLADGDAIVSVRDHGAGIAPDDAERIFQKFVRGRNAVAGGTGLGLYISRRIVDAHRGRIWAASPAGGGATLSFALPAVREPAYS